LHCFFFQEAHWTFFGGSIPMRTPRFNRSAIGRSESFLLSDRAACLPRSVVAGRNLGNVDRSDHSDDEHAADLVNVLSRRDHRAVIGLPIAAAMIFYLVRPNGNRE
jgi:hypothetical protein